MTINHDNPEGQAGSTCLPLSIFPGRVICKGMCGMPVTQLSPRGFCMSCEDEAKTAGTIAVLASKSPRKGFKEALAEVQRSGRPLTLDLAEAAEEALGGAGNLARMIVADLKKVKGEHLDPELQVFHETDWKVAKGLTEMLVNIFQARDKLAGDAGDPLADVSEADLMAIASQAALLQIESDAEFRVKILDAIIEADAEAVLAAAGRALDKIEAGPKVEVVES